MIGGEALLCLAVLRCLIIVRLKEATPMIDSIGALAAWFPQAFVGTLFILMGCLKLYGFARGIQGGRDKPFGQRLCGA